jgi:hypothetical protein
MDPSGHDTALRDLIGVIATGTGLDACGLATWVKTLRAWYGVVADDDYWFLALMNEDQGGFERPVSSQDVDMVRAGAVRMAAEPLILAARAAVVANDKDTVCRVVAALTDLKDTGPWASSALEEIQCVISIVSP